MFVIKLIYYAFSMFVLEMGSYPTFPYWKRVYATEKMRISCTRSCELEDSRKMRKTWIFICAEIQFSTLFTLCTFLLLHIPRMHIHICIILSVSLSKFIHLTFKLYCYCKDNLCFFSLCSPWIVVHFPYPCIIMQIRPEYVADQHRSKDSCSNSYCSRRWGI